MRIAESELILNSDGSVYHLNLLPGEVANTIILVGDPERVPKISRYFDKIEIQKTKREFVIHTGFIGTKRITVLSTGMGTDNIDITLNELDALFNIDFETRTIKEQLTSLQFIRIGTSGAVLPEIDVDTFLASEMAIGLDGLMGFYQTKKQALDVSIEAVLEPIIAPLGVRTAVTYASEKLLHQFAFDMRKGVTITNTGFYAPQGRSLRLTPTNKHFIDELIQVDLPGNRKITNMEMETSGIYGLCTLMGHEAISLNAILANRANGIFTKDAYKTVDKLIQITLERIAHQ